MKIVAYTFGKIDWRRKFPHFKSFYQEPTEYLFSLGEKNGLKFILTDLRAFKNNCFKQGWFFDNKWQKIKRFCPDVIYDKSGVSFKNIGLKVKINEKVPIINHPLFDLICEHKFLSYLYFKEYSPKTFILNKKSISKILKEIKTKLIVTKPPFGSGGKNVKIIPRQNLAQIKIKNELIAQKFIDSSWGIKNIVNTYHDLRVVIVNGKISYSYLRIPQKKSLIANIAKGGKMVNVEKSQIPKKALEIVKNIDKQFQDFLPRIYTIDLIFDKQQKPWLIELNSKPGIYFYPQDKKIQKKFYLDIINLLK